MGQEKRNLSSGMLIARRLALRHAATLILCIIYYMYVQDDSDMSFFRTILALTNYVRVSWLYHIAILVSGQHGPRKTKFIRRNIN